MKKSPEDVMKTRRLTEFARDLRRNSTDAERLLWKHLRARRFSKFKFRRQHVLGDFILDFYCASARLVIEVDGGRHTEKNQAAYDGFRTETLEGCRVRVLRFWNHEVLERTDDVLDEIYRALCSRGERPGR